MSVVLLDFGYEYVKIWVLKNDKVYSLEDPIFFQSVRSQLWMNESGNFCIGEYDNRASKDASTREGFVCSLEILYKLASFPEEAKLLTRNISIGQNVSPLLSHARLLSSYQKIMKIFLDELLHAVISTTDVEAIEEILVLKSDLGDGSVLEQLTAYLPLVFVSKSQVMACSYGIEKFEIDEIFIVLDLGEFHSGFIVAKKTSDDSVMEIKESFCDVGGRYIDVLIYNYVKVAMKSKYAGEEIELQMKQCESVKKKVKTGLAMVNIKLSTMNHRFFLNSEVYEEVSKPYVKRVVAFVRKNAREVNLNEVNNVFLTGGSSKVVGVEEELMNLFGDKLKTLRPSRVTSRHVLDS